MVRATALVALWATSTLAFAQWADITNLGTGGESSISTDGQGTIYVSSHLPTQVFVSKDWGAKFTLAKTFPDSLGDVINLALPEGQLLVAYMPHDVNGMVTQFSTDFGHSFTRGAGIEGRPLDREWMIFNPAKQRATLIYSDGYIGGPRSKGVFISQSDDFGMNWKETARVDREIAGYFAIDPHIAQSSDGKIYAFWNVTKDYVHVESYRIAVSTDGGKSFGPPVTIATLPLASGDTQERWMLGGITAHGTDDLAVFYVAYEKVGGANCLRVKARISHDAGKTFGVAINATSEKEISEAVPNLAVVDSKPVSAYSYPIQMMTWGTYDADGALHLTWMDNRDGRTNELDKWHVRYTSLQAGKPQFEPSERVSRTFLTKRPALDFMSCAVDKKNIYVSWSENIGSSNDMDFSGNLYVGRKPLGVKK